MNKSVAGLTHCPNAGLFHDWNDHPNEIDTCDRCGKFAECIINCEAPKSSKLTRTCLGCKEKIDAERSEMLKNHKFRW